MRVIIPLLILLTFGSSSICYADTRLSINPNKPGPVINKNVYGQFAEHLGRLLYDGLWVGPESKVPNTRGWRDDGIKALKAIKVPVVRWPGGCFADEYHWRNGIGPREARPVTVNTLWGGVEESNAVGTHEFFDLVEQLGAEAYVNGNLGSGTPGEMAQWLEYLTSDSQSDLARLRRKNGRDEPFRVHHFGIGNESWGCGGHMSPEYYTNLYKHWSTLLRIPWDVSTEFVASGGHGYHDAVETNALTGWTEYLSANIKPNFLLGFDAISFHYYTHPMGTVFTEKGSATGFPEKQWISTLSSTLKMDEYIAANRSVLDKNDPDGKVGLYIDEWGTWYDVTEGSNPAFLEQQNSLRDAVVAALNFNIFHKYADRVQMTNIAQMVNVLQAMILTDKDKMLLTPTYYAYKMYVPFQQATTLALELGDVPQYQLGDLSIPAISASAARGEDGKLYLALVNTHPHESERVSVQLVGTKVSSVSGQILTASSMDAHNTFSKPLAIVPVAYQARAKDGALVLDIPAKAILVVAVN
ncbi:MAG: alpha-L-arabinofuranosidase C-terminal domain-containing protein [Halioglobus sp.]